MPPPQRLACSSALSLCVAADGRAFFWCSSAGTLVQTPVLASSTPAIAAQDVVEVSAGETMVLLRMASGGIIQWGGLLGELHWRDKCTAVACGSEHAVLVDERGDVWTWGMGSHGALGHGDLNNRDSPTLVQSLQGVHASSVAAGAKHSLCASLSGDAYAWGFSGNGRLGMGAAMGGHMTPERIQALSKAVVLQVSAGEAHSAAVTDDGKMFTWGHGGHGRLGLGQEVDVYYPALVQGVASRGFVVMASLGTFHTCALMRDGRLFTWGGGAYGKLGLGKDLSNHLTPVEVSYKDGFAAVAAGPMHTLAATQSGVILSWGAANCLGRSSTNSGSPEPVEGGLAEVRIAVASLRSAESSHLLGRTLAAESRHVTLVSVGAQHSLALTKSGSMYTWGSNNHGQLGIGGGEISEEPRLVQLEAGGGAISHAACGAYHTLCVDVHGDVFACGQGQDHQLGNGLTSDLFLPEPVTPPNVASGHSSIFTKVFAGENNSAVISSEGHLYVWGGTDLGKLGLGRQVANLSSVAQVTPMAGDLEGERIKECSLGLEHTLVLCESGRVFACGAGWFGRLGLGSVESAFFPTRVNVPEAVVQVCAGTYHSLAVTASGRVMWWGKVGGRLMDTPVLLPSYLNVDRPIARACAGADCSFLVAANGSVLAVGRSERGRLGLGPQVVEDEVVAEPTEIPNLNLDAEGSMAAMKNHVLAASGSGTVHAWGAGDLGRLGRAAGKDESTPSPLGFFHGDEQDPEARAALERKGKSQIQNQLDDYERQCEVNNVAPPMWAVQALLKRAEQPELRESALVDMHRHVHDEEASCLADLKRVASRQDELVHLEQTIRLTIASALQLFQERIGAQGSRALCTRSSAGRVAVTNGRVPGGLDLQTSASLPAMEQILSLLLVHPGYMIRLYKVWVERSKSDEARKVTNVRWPDLYLGLVRDLYRLSDPHSQRLFARLHRRISAREMLQYKRDVNPTFAAFASGVRDRFLAKMLDGYLQVPLVVRWVVKQLDEHVKRMLASDVDYSTDPLLVFSVLHSQGMPKPARLRVADIREQRKDLFKEDKVRREIEVRVKRLAETSSAFFHSIADACTDMPLGLRNVFNNYCEELGNSFSARGVNSEEDAVPLRQRQLATTKLLIKTLFLPALQEPHRFGWTRATEKQILGLSAVADFLDNVASGRRYTEPWLQALNGVVEELENEAVNIAARLAGQPGKRDESVDLVTDLVAEHLREQPLVIYVTQRTLGFVHYAMLRSLDYITWGEDDVLVKVVQSSGGLRSKAEAELRAQQFVRAADSVDDSWTLALRLDLKMLDLGDSAGGGLRSMMRLDVVTLTPIPRLVSSPDAQPLPVQNVARLALPESLRAVSALLLALPDLDPKQRFSEVITATKAGNDVALAELARRAQEVAAEPLADEEQLALDLLEAMRARRLAYDVLLSEQVAAHGLRDNMRRVEVAVDERAKALTRYLKALRGGNLYEQNRVVVAGIAKRLGREYALSEPNIIASLRVHKRREWTREPQDALVARIKSDLVDAGVVRGGFAQLALETLRQRGVVSDDLRLPGAQQGGDMAALVRHTSIVFSAVGASRFQASILFAKDTVVAVADVEISALMALARALVVAWRPQAGSFPVEFSVKKLLALLEEISLSSFF